MNSDLNKILTTLSLEYITLDENSIVLDVSAGAKKFSMIAETLEIGQPFSLKVSENFKLDPILKELFQGRRDSYQISGIQQPSALIQHPRSINLHFLPYIGSDTPESKILVLFEESTSQQVLEKKVAQKSNEASLLAMAWSTSQAYLDKIINSMAEALIVTDSLGTIKKFNQATQIIFGYDRAELLDRNISFLLPNQTSLTLLDSPSDAGNFFELEGDGNLEIACLTKSGETIIVEFSCTRIPTDIDNSPDFVCLGKDITNRVKAEAKLRQALEKEKEINELKSRFVAMTSHELRTPLNTILFASELLRGAREEETDELLEAIEFNIKRLTELVDYVSMVGKTELETIELKKSTLELVEFCQGLTYEIKLSHGNDSAIAFSSEAKKIQARVDSKILRHTLKILLSNIVKYSSKIGQVNLKLTQENGDIIFWVKAPPKSLPIVDRQKLLASCYSSGSLSEIPETGLGFAIAQKYARLQGGRIEVEDNARTGTVFKVTIPDSNSGDRS